MDEELKQYLDGKFAEIDKKFAAQDAKFATKKDLEGFATKDDLKRVETSLLTAFHKWASPVEKRERANTAMLHALDSDMEALRERVQKLENRS
jgi:hypothetical protein